MCAKAKEDKQAVAAEKAAAKAAAKAAKAAKAKPKAKAKKRSGANEFNFFLLHGEKIGIAAAVLIFGAMVAGGSGLKQFALTPDQISQSAKRAGETIDKSEVKPAEYDEELVPTDYNEYAALIKSFVRVNAYETANRWEQSLFPDKKKRPNIEPLPLENLRATACVGAIQYRDQAATAASSAMGGGAAGGMGGGMAGGGMAGGGAMGGGSGMMGGATGKLEGKRWITLTGSIPIRKQQAAYSEAFGTAQYLDDLRDQPMYIYYRLQRKADGGDWEDVNVIRAYQKENMRWAGVGSEQVGFSYFAPATQSVPMAMSCPPMANKPFGEEIANLPNIPLNSSDQLEVQEQEMAEWQKLQETMNTIDEATILGRDPFANAGAAGAMGGSGMMGGMGAGGMGGAMGGGGMGGSGGMGGGMGGMNAGADNSWLVNREAAQASMLRVQASAAVEYYLFRYFDFDVEENKSYTYRVKLVLANPNGGVEERFLEDPTSTERTIVESEFSEESNPVSFARMSRVYAEGVTAPTRLGAEPTATLSSIYFDDESATESLLQGQTLRRGQIANFYKKPHNAVDVAGARGMMGGMGGSGGMAGGGYAQAGGRGGKKGGGKVVDHITDVCLVDVEGGVKIGKSGDLRSPGRILLLEPNGQMTVREVKEDARELGRYDGSQGGGFGGMGTGAAGMMM